MFLYDLNNWSHSSKYKDHFSDTFSLCSLNTCFELMLVLIITDCPEH